MSEYSSSLSRLITLDNLPTNLGFIQDGLNTIFANLYFKDFYVTRRSFNKEVYYDITIVSYTRLGLDLDSKNGFSLVLNPSFVNGNTL